MVIDQQTLPFEAIGWEFQGAVHGRVDVSFILVDAAPGDGPALHEHPYLEVIIVQEGEVTAIVGDRTITATGGQILVIPAHTPHRFVNSGVGRLRQVDIHVSPTFRTTWL